MGPFEPRPSLTNGHAMTLYSWGNPRHFPRLPPPTKRFFDVAPDTRVVADCHWHGTPWEHPTLVALHGLNGSSDAHYMRGLAAKAFSRGMTVVRHNQRNCGDTERLSDIVEATSDLVVITDRENNMLYMNTAARQFFDLDLSASIIDFDFTPYTPPWATTERG